MLVGVAAAGSVSCSHACEAWPSMPPGAAASAITIATGISASAASRPRPASLRGAGRRAPGRDEVDRQPEREQDAAHEQRAARPRSWPASVRAASGTRSVESASRANAHATPARPTTARHEQRQRAAQPQRHDREPEREADQQRQQRAARVGEHQADEQQPERRPRERVGGRVARAPRRQPQQRRHAERRHQPDRVPVAERLAQPRERLVRRQRAREDLGGQRPRRRRSRSRARRR